MLPRVLFGMYLLLRLAEAEELGYICYVELHNMLVAAVLVFCFLFGLAVVLVGVNRLGVRFAVTWHIALEALILPLSICLAKLAADAKPHPQSILSLLPYYDRLGVILTMFFLAQGLLAVAGLHVVRWMTVETSDVVAH
jgi:hypothetical protein